MWRRNKVKGEIHPLALQKTKHVNFLDHVTVREFANDLHPSAVFKIQHLSLHDFGESEEDTSYDECRNSYLLQIADECSESSTITAEDEVSVSSIVTGEDEVSETESSLEIESRLTDSDDEAEDIAGELYEEKMYFNKEHQFLPVSPKAESFKIKWSCKRKKKIKLRLRTPQRSRKLLFLGDMCTGKSSLITTYCRDKFHEEYYPTILHCCMSDAKVFGKDITLILVDSSGRDDFKPLRHCSYHYTDVAVICYSAGERATLERIKTYWLPELRENVPKCPFVIVEAKKDIRDDYEDKKYLMKVEEKTESLEYSRICKELDERIVPCGLGKEIGSRVGSRRIFHNLCSVSGWN